MSIIVLLNEMHKRLDIVRGLFILVYRKLLQSIGTEITVDPMSIRLYKSILHTALVIDYITLYSV